MVRHRDPGRLILALQLDTGPAGWQMAGGPSTEKHMRDAPSRNIEPVSVGGPRPGVKGSVEGPAGFLIALALILVLKWDSLSEPPFWDTAMGLFPAAITLAANGFDILGLLAMPGYLEGGPNAHSTSPVTLATAAVIALMGGGTRMFVVLHLLHFAVAAWALVTLFRLARPSFGQTAAGLFALSVLLHPTFSAQVGYLYLEVALFLCAVSAIGAWTRRRFWPAVLWSTLAWATKQAGIIVAATLALATLLERRPARDKARRMGAILGLPALWTAGVTVLRRIAAGGADDLTFVPSFDLVFGGLGQYLARFLLNVPDLLVYFVVFVVAAAASGIPILRAMREEPTDPRHRTRERHELLVMGYTGLAIVLFALAFLVALPVGVGFTAVLPRYYVVILPFLLLWLGYAVKRLQVGRVRSAPVLFAALSVVFAINTNGVLYPPDVDTEGPGNDPPLTERSNAYKRLLALELEAVRALEELPHGVPVYYGHFEHYLFRYPTLGYARGPLSNGHNFMLEPLAPLVASDEFPPCVYALYNYPWLGGEKLRGLIGLPEVRPEVSSEVVREFRDDPYVILLFRIQRSDVDCSP
jgi:hypothetical protein